MILAGSAGHGIQVTNVRWVENTAMNTPMARFPVVPMYYMTRALKERGLAFGRFLAIVYFDLYHRGRLGGGGGNMLFQANQHMRSCPVSSGYPDGSRASCLPRGSFRHRGGIKFHRQRD